MSGDTEFDLIVGMHSIVAALKNPDRRHYKLVGDEDSLSEIKKLTDLSDIKIEQYSSHKVQEEAKVLFKAQGREYHRVPGNCFLQTSSLGILSPNEFYSQVKSETRILALDQISDVHNAGAILRTAAFFNIDFVLVPPKNSFGLTSSFYRIASGATEYVKLVEISKLSRAISKLNELGCLTIALSEHASDDLDQAIDKSSDKAIALVLGKEDSGISNAVMRVCQHKLSLESQGEIKSLNVSIASALAMQKCFAQY